MDELYCCSTAWNVFVTLTADLSDLGITLNDQLIWSDSKHQYVQSWSISTASRTGDEFQRLPAKQSPHNYSHMKLIWTSYCIVVGFGGWGWLLLTWLDFVWTQVNSVKVVRYGRTGVSVQTCAFDSWVTACWYNSITFFFFNSCLFMTLSFYYILHLKRQKNTIKLFPFSLVYVMTRKQVGGNTVQLASYLHSMWVLLEAKSCWGCQTSPSHPPDFPTAGR